MEKISLAVHEFIADLIAEKVWGSITFNFEAGEIRTIRQDLVWKSKDLCEAYAGRAGKYLPLPERGMANTFSFKVINPDYLLKN